MLIEDSDAIFITTPDGEIQGVWNKLIGYQSKIN